MIKATFEKYKNNQALFMQNFKEKYEEFYNQYKAGGLVWIDWLAKVTGMQTDLKKIPNVIVLPKEQTKLDEVEDEN